MAQDIENPTNPDYVQSLARGLSVITSFSAQNPVMTLTEVAEKSDLTRATARRFLLTLEQLGYVRSEGKNFSLTPKVLELGFSYISSLGLTEMISPHLATLAAQVHESASAAVLDGSDIVYIARTAGRKIMQVQINLGTRFPAYATSMGRVLLAGLDQSTAQDLITFSSPQKLTQFTKTGAEELTAELNNVKSQGYACVDQELEIGLRSLAVPVHNKTGEVIAAINVSTTSSASIEQTIVELLEPLKECAQSIEKDLKLSGL